MVDRSGLRVMLAIILCSQCKAVLTSLESFIERSAVLQMTVRTKLGTEGAVPIIQIKKKKCKFYKGSPKLPNHNLKKKVTSTL